MRYEDKCPGIAWLDEIPHTGIFKHHVIGKCWICGSYTTFYDMDFQAPTCSEECSEIAWKRYCDACQYGVDENENGCVYGRS